MVDNIATYINETNYPKATTKKITNANLATATTPLPGGTKLGGKLVLKDYLELTDVDLQSNELKEAIFINCPNLKNITVSNQLNQSLEILDIEKLAIDSSTGEPKTNVLETLFCGGNKIKKIDFTYCQKLLDFVCPNNPALNLIINIDHVDGIETINMRRTGPVKIMHATKENVFREVVNQVKEIFGVESIGDLSAVKTVPDPNDSSKTIAILDKSKLQNELKDKVVKSSPLKTEKETAEKDRDDARAERDDYKKKLDEKHDYKDIWNERQLLKQQIENIKIELGLKADVTQQKIIDKIKELKGGPTGPNCSHTDYDSIKSERDNLKTENTQLKRDKDNNKENVEVKKDLIKSTNEYLKKWGIEISKDNKSKIQNADSVKNIEEVRNSMISSEIDKLKSKNNSSFYLNIGLGALTVVSLLALCWVIMRQNALPKIEAKKEKK